MHTHLHYTPSQHRELEESRRETLVQELITMTRTWSDDGDRTKAISWKAAGSFLHGELI